MGMGMRKRDGRMKDGGVFCLTFGLYCSDWQHGLLSLPFAPGSIPSIGNRADVLRLLLPAHLQASATGPTMFTIPLAILRSSTAHVAGLAAFCRHMAAEEVDGSRLQGRRSRCWDEKVEKKNEKKIQPSRIHRDPSCQVDTLVAVPLVRQRPLLPRFLRPVRHAIGFCRLRPFSRRRLTQAGEVGAGKRGWLGPGQDPHEEELDDVGVEEEKLRPLVALRSRVGLHRAAGVARRLGQEDVFEGAHLGRRSRSVGSPKADLPGGEEGGADRETEEEWSARTRKRELARKV